MKYTYISYLQPNICIDIKYKIQMLLKKCHTLFSNPSLNFKLSSVKQPLTLLLFKLVFPFDTSNHKYGFRIF